MAPRLRFFAVLLLLALAGFPQSFAYAQSDLARAYRVIASKQFVDLTHSFGPNTPVWSCFGQAKMTPAADPKTHKPYTIKDDGFRATFYEMVGQYGTHVDPPAWRLIREPEDTAARLNSIRNVPGAARLRICAVIMAMSFGLPSTVSRRPMLRQSTS